MKKIAIVGGGAAGLMCAAILCENGRDKTMVMLFDKNEYLGAKVLISGGGRCNVTTGIFDVKKLLENYPRGAKFLMSAMYRFSPEKVMAWFENHGVKLKTEKDLRVFPKSDNGKDVVGAMEKVLGDGGSEIYLKTSINELQKTASGFKLLAKDGRVFDADCVVLTTGGNAYRHTGSTGDGYAFAKAMGHKITMLAPSLSSFQVVEPWVVKLAGISWERAKLILASGVLGDKFERTGPFVFTHQGVSGPAVFAVSALAAYETISLERPAQLMIDFFPDENYADLEKRLLKLADQNGKKQLLNFLDLILPRKICLIFQEILGFKTDFTVAKVDRALRTKIMGLLKSFPLTLKGRGGSDEFVTAGGVDLSEVNTNTMESKICPGLYFGGEILDVDGFTGGFNLQASWATGNLAAESIIALERELDQV